MTIGEIIREARLQKGMTQQELADILGYRSRTTINKIELGVRDIPRNLVVKFANALDLSIECLLFDTILSKEDIESMQSKSLKDRIKRLRLKKGLTLEQVGDYVGVGKATVLKWETGIIQNIRTDKIEKLAIILGTTPSFLMNWGPDYKSQDSNEKEKQADTPKSQSLSIGQKIRYRRKELGLSVDELAERIEKNRATIYRYESSYIENLPVTVLERLAKALNVTPGYFIDGDSNQRKQDKFLEIYTRLTPKQQKVLYIIAKELLSDDQN